jgi:hypothetical protein
MSKNIWSEIRRNYEDEGIVHIDAWTTPDDNEEGTVIAKVDTKTGKVEYIDKRAKTDAYAQEIIQNVLSDREEEFNVQGEVKESDFDEIETYAPENFSDLEVAEFKKKWGQSHMVICDMLGYHQSHSISDELLMVDYFYIEVDHKWYNKCASMYTPREQAIADYLRTF